MWDGRTPNERTTDTCIEGPAGKTHSLTSSLHELRVIPTFDVLRCLIFARLQRFKTNSTHIELQQHKQNWS